MSFLDDPDVKKHIAPPADSVKVVYATKMIMLEGGKEPLLMLKLCGDVPPAAYAARLAMACKAKSRDSSWWTVRLGDDKELVALTRFPAEWILGDVTTVQKAEVVHDAALFTDLVNASDLSGGFMSSEQLVLSANHVALARKAKTYTEDPGITLRSSAAAATMRRLHAEGEAAEMKIAREFGRSNGLKGNALEAFVESALDGFRSSVEAKKAKAKEAAKDFTSKWAQKVRSMSGKP